MDTWSITVATSALLGHLAIGLFAAFSWGRSPMATPLACMAVSTTTWTLASSAPIFSDSRLWHYIDRGVAPLIPASVLFVVLRFTGTKPNIGERFLWGVSIAFASVALLTSSFEWARLFEKSQSWAVVYLVIANPIVFVSLRRLWLYRLHTVGGEERIRTYLMMSALIVGWGLALTELFADLRWPCPRLGRLGLLASSCMLAVAVLRYQLLEGQPSTRYLGPALLGVLGLSSLALEVSTGSDIFLLAIVPSLMIGSGIVIPFWKVALERRQRFEHLSSMGRMVAQVAHDLRTPIGTIQGAAQFLLTEIDNGRPITPHRQYLKLVEESAQRLVESLSAYQRFGRLQLDAHPISVEEVLEAALRVVSPSITILKDMRPSMAKIDRTLVQGALENVLKNAVEAMPNNGRLTIGTGGEDTTFVYIEDEGPGIPLRLRSAVFEDFHTTKATGAGLGLPFVRQVVEAHGGHISLEDRPKGVGFRVTVHFPKFIPVVDR